MANKQEIQFHYDVDNDFFKIFLDQKYMIYSCALWENATSLEEAQSNKLKRIADFAHIKPGHHILDIGCGWGGMLDYCLKERSVKSACGLTLSNAQYQAIYKKCHPHLTVYLNSWQEFNKEPFDAIISIGAMEHFVTIKERKLNQHIDIYRNFFKKCFELSKPSCFLALQTIVTLKKPDSLMSMRDTHYLLNQVFPGSALPEMKDLQKASEDFYELLELRTLNLDYVRTLLEWRKRLNQHKDYVIECYGEELWKHYNRYFSAAERNFANGYTALVQISFKKINE